MKIVYYHVVRSLLGKLPTYEKDSFVSITKLNLSLVAASIAKGKKFSISTGKYKSRKRRILLRPRSLIYFYSRLAVYFYSIYFCPSMLRSKDSHSILVVGTAGKKDIARFRSEHAAQVDKV